MHPNVWLILIFPRVPRVASSSDPKADGYRREDEDLEHFSRYEPFEKSWGFVGFNWASCLLRESRGLVTVS
jgi:hypothetical protein